ncbi:MAG: hypothetical protein AAFS10_07145 [Myxococcota bacterium]
MRENPTAIEREIHSLIMTETGEGRPPTEARLIELSGKSRTGVSGSLGRLCERGWVYQAYDRGPYLPRTTQGGMPIKVALIIGKPVEEMTDEERAKLEAFEAKARAKLTRKP